MSLAIGIVIGLVIGIAIEEIGAYILLKRSRKARNLMRHMLRGFTPPKRERNCGCSNSCGGCC